jgi:hypothetical protein
MKKKEQADCWSLGTKMIWATHKNGKGFQVSVSARDLN